MDLMTKAVQRKCRYGWILAVILLNSIAISSAFALGFEVDRTRFTLSLATPVDSIRVKNTTTTGPVSLQTTVMSWKQENGVDKYSPSKDLIVAPPIVTIPLGRTQLMRIGWRAPTPLKTEQSYRVYVEELTPLADEKLRIGVQLKLSVGLPVFIRPDNPQFAYNWTMRRAGGNTLNVTLQNTGNMHIQVVKLDLIDAQNKSVGTYSDPFYVLPQQSKSFQVTVQGYAGGPLKLVATTDYETLTSVVNIS